MSTSYPVLDILLLVLLVRLTMAERTPEPAFRCLVAGFTLMLATDLAFLWLARSTPHPSGALLDLGWLASFIALGLSALHPSMASLTRRTAPDAMLSPFDVLGFGLPILVVPVLMLVAAQHRPCGHDRAGSGRDRPGGARVGADRVLRQGSGPGPSTGPDRRARIPSGVRRFPRRGAEGAGRRGDPGCQPRGGTPVGLRGRRPRPGPQEPARRPRRRRPADPDVGDGAHRWAARRPRHLDDAGAPRGRLVVLVLHEHVGREGPRRHDVLRDHHDRGCHQRARGRRSAAVPRAPRPVDRLAEPRPPGRGPAEGARPGRAAEGPRWP